VEGQTTMQNVLIITLTLQTEAT